MRPTPCDEHVYIEEQEPSGRRILPPCVTCGFTAMDMLGRLRAQVEEAACGQQPSDTHVNPTPSGRTTQVEP